MGGNLVITDFGFTELLSVSYSQITSFVSGIFCFYCRIYIYVIVIAGNVIYLRGIDMISGTPVIDVKPCIPQYDSPWNHETNMCVGETASLNQGQQLLHCTDKSSAVLPEALPSDRESECGSCNNGEVENVLSAITCCQISDASRNTVKPEVSVASWITDSVQPAVLVLFTARAEQQLKRFDSLSADPSFRLRLLTSASELRSALTAVLQADPRSAYRRKHCQHQLYFVTVDVAHVTCWFDDDTVEVLKVQSVLALQSQNENNTCM